MVFHSFCGLCCCGRTPMAPMGGRLLGKKEGDGWEGFVVYVWVCVRRGEVSTLRWKACFSTTSLPYPYNIYLSIYQSIMISLQHHSLTNVSHQTIPQILPPSNPHLFFSSIPQQQQQQQQQNHPQSLTHPSIHPSLKNNPPPTETESSSSYTPNPNPNPQKHNQHSATTPPSSPYPTTPVLSQPDLRLIHQLSCAERTGLPGKARFCIGFGQGVAVCAGWDLLLQRV